MVAYNITRQSQSHIPNSLSFNCNIIKITIDLVTNQLNILCQPGLESGSEIRWDDEDDKNRNLINGQHPDGRFDSNTIIKYCCRTDGYATNPINLPTDKPFVLFKSNTRLCQEVNGMEVKDEYFYWDNEDENPGSSITGSINAETNDKLDVKLYYCYYYKKDKH